MSDWQLLTKADVIREYRYPENLLAADIKSGDLPAFLADGSSPKGREYLYGARYYIPRIAVERRIAVMAGMENDQ
jgi:hypothetical protein